MCFALVAFVHNPVSFCCFVLLFIVSCGFVILAHQQQIDKLQRQHGTHRDASYELRAVCLTAIQMALETKRPKFISLALNGMHVSANHLHFILLSFRKLNFV